jgi:hypothetical protein
MKESFGRRLYDRVIIVHDTWLGVETVSGGDIYNVE